MIKHSDSDEIKTISSCSIFTITAVQMVVTHTPSLSPNQQAFLSPGFASAGAWIDGIMGVYDEIANLYELHKIIKRRNANPEESYEETEKVSFCKDYKLPLSMSFFRMGGNIGLIASGINQFQNIFTETGITNIAYIGFAVKFGIQFLTDLIDCYQARKEYVEECQSNKTNTTGKSHAKEVIYQEKIASLLRSGIFFLGFTAMAAGATMLGCCIIASYYLGRGLQDIYNSYNRCKGKAREDLEDQHGGSKQAQGIDLCSSLAQ